MSDAGSKQVRLGVIGTGLAAKRLHWPALAKMPGRFAIVAYANHSRPKADEFAALAGLSPDGYCADYHDLLRRDDVEAVLIGLPIAGLYEAVRASLAAGKDVICEKPVGVDLAQGRQFVALADEYPDRKLLIAENFFYRDDLRLMSYLLTRGEIGRPFLMTYQEYMYMVPAPGDWLSTGWRQTPQHVGGIVLDAGVHHTAAIRLLGGDFARVSAQMQRSDPSFAIPSSLTMNFRLMGGLVGSYTAGYLDVPIAAGASSLLLVGSEGSILADRSSVRLTRADGSAEVYTFEGNDGGYYNEFLNFYEAIVYGEPVVSTVAQNYKNMQAILEGIASAEQGRVIEITEAPGGLSSEMAPLWRPRGAEGLFDGLPVTMSHSTASA